MSKHWPLGYYWGKHWWSKWDKLSSEERESIEAKYEDNIDEEVWIKVRKSERN